MGTKLLERIFCIVPSLVVYGGLIVLLLDDSIHAFFEVGRLIPIELRISLLIAVIASLTWTLSTTTIGLKLTKLKSKQQSRLAFL